MGNVVVSEALRVAAADNQKLVEHYVASQAAEPESSYNLSAWYVAGGPRSYESAWRAANIEWLAFDTDFDMPPNQYTYLVPDRHGKTTPIFERSVSIDENWGSNYYSSIGSAATNIINFYNGSDAALGAWALGQISKPDYAGGPTWDYLFCDADHPGLCGPLAIITISDNSQVNDWFSGRNGQLIWDYDNVRAPHNAEILGHIIPSRSGPLGAAHGKSDGSVITDSVEFTFGASNQGHSAQFYSNFFSQGELGYWEKLLIKMCLLESDTKASPL
jgi:hypothetical protein